MIANIDARHFPKDNGLAIICLQEPYAYKANVTGMPTHVRGLTEYAEPKIVFFNRNLGLVYFAGAATNGPSAFRR